MMFNKEELLEKRQKKLMPSSIWTFAKQETQFENVFKAACIFSNIAHPESENIEHYFNTHDYEGFTCNHRMLSTAQLFGLVTKSANRYDKETVTPVFRELLKYGIGSPEFNTIKTEQLLKIKMSAIIDRSDNANTHKIFPVFYIFDVLHALHQRGVDGISLGQLFSYVMTCESSAELEETVDLLLTNPEPCQYVEQYKSDCRMWTLIEKNCKLFVVKGNRVSINKNYIDFFYNHFYMNNKNVVESILDSIVDFPEAYKRALVTYQNLDIDITEDVPIVNVRFRKDSFAELDNSVQRIFYGAPGTGKSHEISKLTDGEAVVRTTFHPDSDYSTFVGAYKPVMKDVDVPVVPVVVNSGIGLEPGGTYKEKRITYQFVKQAFLKAYLGAWKKYADRCSICCVPAVQEFETGNGRYVINSVGIYDLTLSREFQFPKSLVLKEWPNLWNNGVFELPKGPQTGKSVQHAIANWIFDNIDNCTEEKFDEGWQKLINTFRDKGHVDVQKTQTYIISDVAEDNETLIINVEARGKKKATLKRKFYELDEIKPSKLEKTLVDILKGYSSDFEDAWELLKQNVNEGVTPEVKDESNGQIDSQFLVIEEINRGNCAQIFGDIFQLLDRSDNDFSVYPIEADSDLRDAIKEAFTEDGDYKLSTDIDIEGVIEYTSNYGATLSEDIQSGRVLLFPPNFYIWATMNTSDQSLFPIDSAFKRRWDWVYTPIAQGKDENGKLMEWQIEGFGNNSWWTFIQGINEVIDMTTHSEDKKLGFFFCKAQNGVVKKDTFVNKVIFYLWNDVFKVYGFKSEIFDKKGKDDKTEKITFKSFYNADGSVNVDTMNAFVKNVMAKAPKDKANNESPDVNEEQSEDSEA